MAHIVLVHRDYPLQLSERFNQLFIVRILSALEIGDQSGILTRDEKGIWVDIRRCLVGEQELNCLRHG